MFGGRLFFPLHIPIWEYIIIRMPRAATSTDVFNAIAEARRREIISELKAGQPRSVGELADRLGMQQPAVSKHLGVLRKVGIVSVIKDGRLRLYRLDARRLKPIHDWVSEYEKFWTDQLDRIKKRAEESAKRGAKDKQ